MTACRPTRREFVAGLLGAAATPLVHAEERAVLRAADVHPAGYPTVAAVAWLDSELEREFGGQLRLHLHHSGQLGSEKDTLELARVGALAVTRVHSSVLNNTVPATRILSLPYVIDSTAHLRRAVDGAFGDAILAACERHGLMGLAIYDSGARCIYNTRRPVTVPEDLRGLKLRVPQSDIFLESLEVLGASPTPLAYGAVFSSLQTHLIDGAENNVPSFYSSRHFEVARFWSATEHSYAPDMLLMSRRAANALPTSPAGDSWTRLQPPRAAPRSPRARSGRSTRWGGCSRARRSSRPSRPRRPRAPRRQRPPGRRAPGLPA